MAHISVLLKEVISGLDLKPGSVVFDGTINSAGHSKEIVKHFGNKIKIIGVDLDTNALYRAKENLEKLGATYSLYNDNYSNIKEILRKEKIEKVDDIILDLGLSSDQLEDSERGFTFLNDEPLLMSFKVNPDGGDKTAYEVVNHYKEEDLARIIFEYGEERFARRIARNIVSFREKSPIESTQDLVDIVFKSLPYNKEKSKIHPATKTFQAIRIEVNDELNHIKKVLIDGFDSLNPKGRFLIISFHSLEDRLVKYFFRDVKERGLGEIITKKPLIASAEELAHNSRSRSAKLRILEKK